METKVISFDKTSKCSHCGKDLNFKLYPIFNLQDLTENEFNKGKYTKYRSIKRKVSSF